MQLQIIPLVMCINLIYTVILVLDNVFHLCESYYEDACL